MNLAELPVDHELRRRPLVDIGAEYKHPDSKIWKAVTSAYRIAQKSYNQLGDAWIDSTEWIATKP